MLMFLRVFFFFAAVLLMIGNKEVIYEEAQSIFYSMKASVLDESIEAEITDETAEPKTMYSVTRTISFLLLGIAGLALLASFALLLLGNLGAILILPAGAFTFYYFLIFMALTKLMSPETSIIFLVLCWILMLAPLLSMLFDPDRLLEFLLSPINLDMRH